MIVTMGLERSSKERINPSAFISDAAGSIFAPSFNMALPRLRISSMPGFITAILSVRRHVWRWRNLRIRTLV
jgi:hypothetical protein